MPGNNEEYSTTTGLIYIFNLIVGTGALALPGAVNMAGWFLGIVMVCLLGLVSFITVTFIMETLSTVNAIARHRLNINSIEEENEDTPLVNSTDQEEMHPFEIIEKFEICEMATILLPKSTRIIVFICLIIYLLGDLSIYCAVIAKTLTHIFCTSKMNIIKNEECNLNFSNNFICWNDYNISRLTIYRGFICIFIILIGPFTFFNLKKTKLLQLLTIIMRWIAFLIMIIWSIQKMIINDEIKNPSFINFYHLPTLFGTCIYSFMCQHSIPGLIQPISNKSNLKNLIGFDFIMITIFYLLLAITAVFTFEKVEDLYSLNFWIDSCNKNSSIPLMILDYYLALFPVFTLSTSFPIISITLKNNLKKLFFSTIQEPSFWMRMMISILPILLPVTLALIVSDLHILVGVVGSYAGAGVQYLIPCLLVVAARNQAKNFSFQNPYASPFGSDIWVYGVYVWMALSLILITVNYFYHS